jgi:hypothetical protein
LTIPITNCYATGDVTSGSSSGGTGGFIGISNSGHISECYALGDVHGSVAGGFVGSHEWNSISNCYSLGSVSGISLAGGFAGYNPAKSISYCYSAGRVTISSTYQDPGGFTGGVIGGVEHSFWDIETSGVSTSYGGRGESTSKMKTQSTFTDEGWDFSGIWKMSNPGGKFRGYPVFD